MASVAEILLAQGRQRADARRQQGQVSAQMWTNLADIIGQAGSQFGQQLQQRQAQQDADAEAQALRELFSGDQLPQPNQIIGLLGPERGAKVLDGLKTLTELGQQKTADARESAGRLARGVAALPPANQQEWWPQIRQAAIAGGLGDEQSIPEQLTPEYLDLVQRWASGELPEQPEDFTLSPGQTRFGPDGKPIANVPAPTPAPRMHSVVVKGPNGEPIRKLVPEEELMAGVPEYRAPVQAPAPSFQAREVLNDAGKPVMANFDARTGQYTDPSTGQAIQNPRPVPSPLETQDARKFKQADPILRSVDELSERINTQSGLIAKMAGGAAKLQAQANYNDDVAEYEALISGFTPLVARALGHTGVLTQQDVDSVKALFPRPGDSKSLRDRKIARIKSIIGDLESNASPATPPPGRVYYDENGDPVQR